MTSFRCTRPALSAFLGVWAALCLTGCSGCGRITNSTTGPANDGEHVVTKTPLESVKELTSGTLDILRAQEAVKYLNQITEVRDEVAKVKLDREHLTKRFGLTAAEVDSVLSTSYTTLDAYHLEWCFRLRDVARSLKLDKHSAKNAGALDRAQRAFGWVTRQIVLQDQGEELLPPQFVLARGWGDARARMLIFIDLLQQLELTGCIITCPAKQEGGKFYWLAGVLIPEDGPGQIYLFEPRLGLPVPGPGGKGIATLAQLRKQPEILQQLSAGKEHPYAVSADQAAKAEVLFACPAAALEPRMLYVQKQLAKQGRVRLVVDPALGLTSLLDRLEKAGGLPVSVWNQSEKVGKSLPVTPLRALAAFFPPDKGGTDESNPQRQEIFTNQMYPLSAMKAGYRSLHVYDELPPPVRSQLVKFSKRLFELYILPPHDKLTRGRLENMVAPLNRIDSALEDVIHRPDPEVMEGKVSEWRERVDKVFTLPEKDPQFAAAFNMLFTEDQFLGHLISGGDPEVPLPETARKTLSYIVLRANEEALDKYKRYLLARYFTEKAEQAEFDLANLKDDASPSKVAQLKADWSNAHKRVKNYLDEDGLLPGADHWNKHLSALRQRWEQAADINLPEELIKDLHKGLALSLTQIDALQQTGKSDEARAQAQQLAADIAAIRDSAELKDLFAKFKAKIQKLPENSTRDARLNELDRLMNTLATDSSVAWLGQAAALRAAKM